ncbi:hypothetical protein HUG20_02120 [Salicibibacter cibi]|uniref:Uncharacterized protein n=1 Tax=Salicibibacter cibi TaxID=2743001 RepID=A0A7T6Z8H9_9BACI|nr:DUF6155 family protein [Salicibibacter cibi]QQK78817.1 hypothetical protein HUG20_02120 [Salicibibacter cibi]
MRQLKVTELKKQLKTLDNKELISIISEIYKISPDAKKYLSVKFAGEDGVNDLYQEAKAKIKDEFFPDKGFGKLRLREAKNAINKFKKLTGDNRKVVDLTLFYVEKGVDFTNEYGDIDESFYDSMERAYASVIRWCSEEEDYYRYFADRLQNVVINTDGLGWGFHDGLSDIYYSLPWVE